MSILRKLILLITIAALLDHGNIHAVHYLAPSSGVQKEKTLKDFSKAVDEKTSAKNKEMIRIHVFKDDDKLPEEIPEELFDRLRAENRIESVIDSMETDPDTGEAVPKEEYFRDDALAFVLEEKFVEKAYVTPKTFKYVSKAIETELVKSEWGKYALMDSDGKASFDGQKVLVYRDGLQDNDLKEGVRLYTVFSLMESFTPKNASVIRSAYDIASVNYGGTKTPEGQYLMDDALTLAMILTATVGDKAGPELTAAALLYAVDRKVISPQKVKEIPIHVWRWVKIFQDLNSLEFMPPQTARKPELKEVYIQNYKNYILKYSRDAYQPILLLMAFRMNNLLIDRAEKGADFSDRYDLLINIYSVLAEQLGLKKFSDIVNALSYRKAHEEQRKTILAGIRERYGVSYDDLAVYAEIFRGQIEREIRYLEKKSGRKLGARVIIGVKDPGGIDEKMKDYESRDKDPAGALCDLVRGKIIVDSYEDLDLLRQLPFLQKVYHGDAYDMTPVARNVNGTVPPLADAIDDMTVRETMRTNPRPWHVKAALARLEKAQFDNKTALPVEVQLQTTDMRMVEFRGTALHAIYKMRKRNVRLYAPDVVYDETPNLQKRMRRITSEPQIADNEYIRCRYRLRGGAVEFFHNVPKRLSDTVDKRPAVVDVLTRRDLPVFREYMLNPVNIFINGDVVREFGERIKTGDVVEIQAGRPDPALEKRFEAVKLYVQGAGDKKAAYDALPAGNLQSRVAVTLLLENMSEEEMDNIFKTQLDLLKKRITSDSHGLVDLRNDEDIRSCLEPYNMAHWAFRRSYILQECCLAMHFGFLDPDIAAHAFFSGLGWKKLEDFKVGPYQLENIFRSAKELAGDESVVEALKPFGAFPRDMSAAEMAERVATDIGKGKLDAKAAVNNIRILQVLTKPLNLPEPIPFPPAAVPLETAA